MDIYCPRCGEPWEMDTLHDIAQEKYGVDYYVYPDPYSTLNRFKNDDWDEQEYHKYYEQVRLDFQTRGCVALGSSCSKPSTETDRTFGLTRQEAAGALYDLLGDDLDGAAAMLDDMGY